jgi:type I restriction enzyme S subunit
MSFTANIDDVVAENRNQLLGKHPNWARVPLKEVASILNGYPFESGRFKKSGGVPLIRIRDILPGETATFYVGDFDSAFLVRRGELLVGMDGDFHCQPWMGEPALLNQRVCKISPDESRYSKQFLRYVLPGYLSAINAKTPSVTVKHLSSRTIADIPLPLPPLPEQRRIVAEIEKQFTRLEAGWRRCGGCGPTSNATAPPS